MTGGGHSLFPGSAAPGKDVDQPSGLAAGGRSEVHVTARHAAAGRGSARLLRLVGDDGLGGEEQRGDGGGVLQGRARDLRRVDDAFGDHVDVLTGRGVQAVADGQVAHLLDDDATLETTVDGDLLERGLQGQLHGVGAGQLVTLQVQLLEDRGGLDEGHATTGDDARLDGRLRVANGVLDAVLALLELDLGRGTGLDDGDATGELRQALLELLAVVVRVGLLDLGADLVDAALDLLGVTRTLDDGRLVLGHDDLAGAAQQRDVGGVELEADVLGDDLATGEGGDVLEDRLAAVTEAGRLDGDGLEGAADLVDDQGRQRLALDVLRDDEERLAALH